MPSTRIASNGSTIATTSSRQQTAFTFPEQNHLVITTPRNVFAWDAAGIHTIFRSTRGGIIAAREAKDGSGVLAIASNNVVVMHDTKRGKEESWGLSAPQDEVRHLEYTPDSKSLFLSTTADGTVQHYCTERSRLVVPAHKHEAAPVALAISPTGHMMLSASQNPPVILLKNLAHNTAPLHVQPTASNAAVSCAAFHPERQNVFLLAFRDGSVAAYDATRMAKNGLYANQASVNDGEIGRVASAHRAIASGDDSLNVLAPITGAAFLPGYKTRAVTAGRDGKCKIIDFAKGAVVIRTWHAKAPITSVSVLPLKPAKRRKRGECDSDRSRASASHTIGGPTTTDSIIAVSRVDGKVHLYDGLGLLLSEKRISGMEERILSIEWAKGQSPASADGDLQRHFSEDEAVSLGRNTSTKARLEPDGSLTSQYLGLPSSLRKSSMSRQLASHPDEDEFGTVRHTPAARPQQPAPTGGEYYDLFSPIRPPEAKPKSPTKPCITSPLRNRPRLSSQTFIKSPEDQVLDSSNLSPRQRTSPMLLSAGSHATSSSSTSRHRIEKPKSTLKSSRRAKSAISPLKKSKKHITFAGAGNGSMTSRSGTAAPSAVTANPNAKLLADLRKLSRNDSALQKQGTLSSYAMSHRLKPSTSTFGTEPGDRTSQGNDGPSEAQTESTYSFTFSDAGDDIWLTSGSEDDKSSRRKRRKAVARPPGRQTSRSRMDSKGTVSTSALHSLPSHPNTGRTEGSTEDSAFATAQSHLSPADTFSPASEQVRQLFPRSSSLSPGKKHGHRRSPIGKENTLTRMAVNATFGPQSKSPWARVKAGKRVKPIQVYEDTDGALVTGALPRSESLSCLTCPETKARVQGLEDEVAQLKGEVIALKAILRRNGLPFPACLRGR